MFLYLFESFRWDLNEAKAVYIAEYYLVSHFCNHDAPITSQVSINIVNSHLGERFSGFITAAHLKGKETRDETNTKSFRLVCDDS